MRTLHVFPSVVLVSSASQVTGEFSDLLYEPRRDKDRMLHTTHVQFAKVLEQLVVKI